MIEQKYISAPASRAGTTTSAVRTGMYFLSACTALFAYWTYRSLINIVCDTSTVSTSLIEQLQHLNIHTPYSIGSYLTDLNERYNTSFAINTLEGLTPDTTAVVLNWSRLENMLLIASILCGSWLDQSIAQVFVWNNNPNISLSAAVSVCFIFFAISLTIRYSYF